VIRSAADVGAGLAAARQARRIRPGERIHVVGAAGAGASAAALLAAAAGAEVTGCDPGAPSPYTPALDAVGIAVAPGHDPAHITAGTAPPRRLAVTKALTAVDPDHPELRAARERGIALEPWQQVVADAAVGRTLVGVAGTHGKSTSAGWLVHVLASAGRDPSAFVGALLPGSLTGGVPATARRGRGAPFVVEADEYAGNFDSYRPGLALVTSIEWDHPDVFADEAAVVAAFEAWIRRMEPGGRLVINVGDPGAAVLAARLADWDGSIVAVALVDQAAQRMGGFARAIAEQYATADGPATAILARTTSLTATATTLQLYGLDPLAGPVVARLPLVGRHNAANGLGVTATALALGVAPDAIVAGLSSFAGVGRRLERKGEVGGVAVYDDYGHHPTAIRATIAALRQREPGRRLWAVYEPLTFHRTAALLDAFADSLATADAVAVADIWAGRDPDRTIASPMDLADAVAARRPDIAVSAPGSVEATADWLAGEVRDGDVVLVMGGGRSYVIGERLLAQLDDR
jgi:UDP-N-acetylmuramate--alanine ligase